MSLRYFDILRYLSKPVLPRSSILRPGKVKLDCEIFVINTVSFNKFALITGCKCEGLTAERIKMKGIGYGRLWSGITHTPIKIFDNSIFLYTQVYSIENILIFRNKEYIFILTLGNSNQFYATK